MNLVNCQYRMCANFVFANGVKVIIFLVVTVVFVCIIVTSSWSSIWWRSMDMPKENIINSYNNGAITRLTIAITLIRIFIDGPEVSLNGSPTVSPTTVAA